MRIVFTKHAKESLSFRNIPESKVKTTIAKPDFTDKSRGNTRVFYKLFGQRYLKVIAFSTTEVTTVITSHWINKERVEKGIKAQ